MLRYVNCSWYNFYNFLLNMGIKVHAQSIFYFTHFQKSCMKNGSYLIEIGSESENKWVVDFFVRSKLPGEIQCLVYTGSFLFPLSNDQYCEPTLICVRDIFASFARVSLSTIFSPQTNLFPVIREIRSSQIKVGFHYIEVLTKYMFCKILISKSKITM